MTAADWENPMTDAVIYRATEQNRTASLSISRSDRAIAWDEAWDNVAQPPD